MKPLTTRPFLPFLGMMLFLAFPSCRSSNLGRSWADPEARTKPFSKVAVVALTKQEAYRMQAEDALVQEMPNAVASHTLLPGLNSLHDTAAAIAAIRAAGCDGVLILRLRSGAIRIDPDVAPTQAATPPTSLGQDVDDYWVDPSAQETYSFQPGQYFAVDVRLFDLNTDRKVWTGLAVEYDARDAGQLVRKVRHSVMKDLRDRGLVDRK